MIAKPDAWLDPLYLVTLMKEQSVSSMWGVPSPFTLLMDAAQDVLPLSLVDLHLSGEVCRTMLRALMFADHFICSAWAM